TGPNELKVVRNLRNGDSYEFGSGNPTIDAPAGQYTIAVSESGDRTDSYAFRFIDLNDAQAISLGSAGSGTLADGGATQAYSFDAAAGDRIYLDQLSFSKGIGSSYADWRLI